MVKHELKITVSRPNEEPISMAQFKRLPIIERMRGRWFGKSQRLMVIVPKDSVQKIEVKEV